MSAWLILIPVLTACTGWLSIHVLVRFLFRSKQQQLAVRIGQWVQAAMRTWEPGTILSEETSINTMMPLVEEHIDHFLRVKLPQKMPMIGMLIGDRTIGQLKEIFIAELQELFPTFMKAYLHSAQQELDIAAMVTGRIAQMPPHTLKQAFQQALGKEIRLAKTAAFLLGFVIGLLQLMIIVTA